MSQISENFYTEQEVADFLNKKIASLRSEASRRKGAPRIKVGKKILYKKDSFESWLVRQETDFQKIRK
jgi:hypothetical protein